MIALKIDIPSELVLVVFNQIDSMGDGLIKIEELMEVMRKQQWWRTSSPLGTARSRSKSPPIGTWEDVSSTDRAAMYATSVISQLPDESDREQAIEEAGQVAWEEARERVKRASPMGREHPPANSVASSFNTTVVTIQPVAASEDRSARRNPESTERSAKESKAMRALQVYGDMHLGWGRASP